MKKILIITVLAFCSFISFADEGMWIPLFLDKYNIDDMQKKGFKLTAKDIYDVNQASLKDAIVIFGRGCTGELVSDQGLLFTNHHCGFSFIQKHSSLDHDYLTDGFWAMSKEEELSNPGLTVTFLIYMEDVTSRVSSVYNENMTYSVRNPKIDSVCSVIEKEAVSKSDGKYLAAVEPFFYGNQYILIVTQVYKDVRLVGAPPSSIGKFGGDTDNWVFPRHTGDFMMFRIYADKNNEPAEYSPNNVPYKPKKFLNVNIKGVKEGDFTMVFGYPGFTEEYIPSFSVENLINVENPIQISLRQKKLDIINAAMNSDKQLRIQYASKQAGIANGWKKWIGQNLGLNRIDILKLKKNYEKDFQSWAEQSNKNPMYKTLLKDYESFNKSLVPYLKANTYLSECVFSADIWALYTRVKKQLDAMSTIIDASKIDTLKAKTIKSIEAFYKDYNSGVDKQIFTQMMLSYFNDVDKDFFPSQYTTIQKNYGSDINKYVEDLYSKSILTDKQRLTDFVSNFSNTKGDKKGAGQKVNITDFENDIFVVLLKDFYNVYDTKVWDNYIEFNTKIDSLNHLYMQAQMIKDKEKVFYPDANFTMRVSYGQIQGFRPRDGIIYDYYTTIDGVIEKDNPEIYDYNVPQRIKDLYAKKEFGKYIDKNDGKLHVCFIATNHTSGGNSGSPVLNANGELIGINFDRCWESTMSDIKFDENYCRNIALDIRYVLFIIDKYAGASYLLDEMKIIQ